MSSVRRLMSSCEPCEKLRRALSIPASASERSVSWLSDAGPIVATIFVRRKAVGAIRLRLTGTRESTPAGIRRAVAELFLDPEELVVLRDAIGARERARLDLARVRRDGDVGDRRVLGLAGAMGDDDAVAVAPRELDRLERLGQRPDLVHLHEDRVRDARIDAALQDFRIRHEHVVADELDARAEPLRQGAPGVPVVLRDAVL